MLCWGGGCHTGPVSVSGTASKMGSYRPFPCHPIPPVRPSGPPPLHSPACGLLSGDMWGCGDVGVSGWVTFAVWGCGDMGLEACGDVAMCRGRSGSFGRYTVLVGLFQILVLGKPPRKRALCRPPAKPPACPRQPRYALLHVGSVTTLCHSNDGDLPPPRDGSNLCATQGVEEGGEGGG